MTVQQKLFDFAKKVALPYLLELEALQPYKDDFDILLVGSVATGLCSEKSDVDMCILFNQDIVDEIPILNNWKYGKPSEKIINGKQLHFYATSLDFIHEKLEQFDESVFYLYNTSKHLYKGNGGCRQLKELLELYSSNPERLSISMNKLISRRRALGKIFSDSEDPVLRMEMGLEIIEHLIRTTAQYDQVGYDRRKRLYQTGLQGKMGKSIKGDIDVLISLVSHISDCKNFDASKAFEDIVDQCILLIS
ncbi:hypothetical protein EZV73_01895 [Acidaminobacter sp. JC074]|uniref:nucleotidyltransferase domain-containing protein n=1 Tax=Acidaminobacter sp. JC074 TaxID=2530199 RepID=UPI001F0FCC07|nr:nucleotidyltransferase domain-containing protein [Acidaminobacter sp. JC074]MCH4886297.1 hypothetical protein [Acidaminobacter sp. JC074]